MAYNQHTSAIFLATLLLFAAANPSAHGAIINETGLVVNGTLCCTQTGNCPGQGVGRANVLLNCTILGVTTTVGQEITNADGTFSIIVRSIVRLVPAIIGNILPCSVIVQLPLEAAVCPVLSTTNSTLVSAVQAVGTVASTVSGLVQSATITGFAIISVRA